MWNVTSRSLTVCNAALTTTGRRNVSSIGAHSGTHAKCSSSVARLILHYTYSTTILVHVPGSGNAALTPAARVHKSPESPRSNLARGRGLLAPRAGHEGATRQLLVTVHEPLTLLCFCLKKIVVRKVLYYSSAAFAYWNGAILAHPVLTTCSPPSIQ